MAQHHGGGHSDGGVRRGVGVAYLGGYVAGTVGYRPVFLMGSVLVFAGAALFWAYFRIPRGELAREATAARSLP